MLSPRDALVTLNLIPGLGSVRIRALLEFFGSAELVLAAPQNMLREVPRVGATLAAAIADWRNCTQLEEELRLAEQWGVRLITLTDADYPAVLRRMDDPPIVLYVRGEWRPEDGERGVSLVGSRLASPRGLTLARRFARELADSGSTIISGLARGIDTAGHWGALDAGGRTIAVLGSGMAQLFPRENEELARRICDGHGAVVSEFPMSMRPSRTSFPQRNRIVAAWSQATLVVEAPHRSGALHTARLSAEHYGNSVFALPGDVDNELAAGCNALIRDGAILCTSPQDLLDDMGWSRGPRQLELFGDHTATTNNKATERPPLATADRPLMQAIAAGHDTLDTLCSALGLAAGELTPRLMRLQVEGQLIPLPGGRYAAPSR